MKYGFRWVLLLAPLAAAVCCVPAAADEVGPGSDQTGAYATPIEDGLWHGRWQEQDGEIVPAWFCAKLTAGEPVNLRLETNTTVLAPELLLVDGLARAGEDASQLLERASTSAAFDVEEGVALLGFEPQRSGMYSIAVDADRVGIGHADFRLQVQGTTAAPEKCQPVLRSLAELTYQSELLPNYFGPNDWFVLFQIGNVGDFGAGNVDFFLAEPEGHVLVGGYALAPGCMVGEAGEFICDVANMEPWDCLIDDALLSCRLPLLPVAGSAPLVVHLQGEGEPDLTDLVIELGSTTAPGSIIRVIDADSPSGLCPVNGVSRQPPAYLEEGNGLAMDFGLTINAPLPNPLPWMVASMLRSSGTIVDSLPALGGSGGRVYTTQGQIEGSFNTSLRSDLDLGFAALDVWETSDSGQPLILVYVDARGPLVTGPDAQLLVSMQRSQSVRDFFFDRNAEELRFETTGILTECNANLVRDPIHDIVEAAVEVLPDGLLEFSMQLGAELPSAAFGSAGLVPAYLWRIDLGGTHDGAHGDIAIGVRYNPSLTQWQGFISQDGPQGSLLATATEFGAITVDADRVSMLVAGEDLGLIANSTWRAQTLQSVADQGTGLIFDVNGALAPPLGMDWALLPFP